MCESVCVCVAELTAFTVMAAEVTGPEEIRSPLPTTGNLTCSKCTESTAHQQHLLCALQLRREGESK